MIHVINGPNLNLLGKREPDIYGTRSLNDICEKLAKHAAESSKKICFFQSNHEGALIDYMQKLGPADGVILNPGALAHTSIALRDCIAAIEATVLEVHISNISAREEFRKTSIITPVCCGVIAGLGADVYRLALNWFIERE